jgi:hypothetical protein
MVDPRLLELRADLYATAGEGYLAYGLAGLVVNIVVLWLLLGRFKARAGAM